MSMMLCAFSPSSRPLSIQADVLLSSLSLSTPVGRFDGSGSPSPHPFFPSSTLSPSRERCMHDRSVSAPHRHVLFLFLIRCLHRSSNDTALEQCPSKSSTKSEIPAVIIFCIIASAGTSLLKSYTSKKAEHLTHPCWPFLGIPKQTTTQSSSSSSAHSSSTTMSDRSVSARGATNTARKCGSSGTCSGAAWVRP